MTPYIQATIRSKRSVGRRQRGVVTAAAAAQKLPLPRIRHPLVRETAPAEMLLEAIGIETVSIFRVLFLSPVHI